MNISAIHNQAPVSLFHHRFVGVILQFMLVLAVAASAQEAWTVQSDPDLVFNFESIAWTGERFVAVGEGGIYASTDAVKWQNQSTDDCKGGGGSRGLGCALISVIWTGTNLVAVGPWGGIATSMDGLVWKTSSNWLGQYFQSVTWTGDQYVVVGLNGLIWTSRDVMDSLHLETSGILEHLNSVTWTGTQLVAVGAGGVVLTSPDGKSWTRQSTSKSEDFCSVVWTGTQLVAVGFEGRIASSKDGVDWVDRPSGLQPGARLESVAWTGGKFVAVGWGICTTSKDGEVWTSGCQGLKNGVNALVWASNRLVGVGFYGSFAESKDGSIWEESEIGLATSLPSVIWGNKEFVAVGQNHGTGVILTSPNGASWTAHSIDSTYTLYSVVWTGEQYVAVGADGVGSTGLIVTSPDGVRWTRRSVESKPLQTVLWTGKHLVAIEADGRQFVSKDGVVWTNNEKGSKSTLGMRVEWMGNMFVAIDPNLEHGLMTSPDGVTWNVADIRTNKTPCLILSTGKQILAFEDDSTWTSSDGLVWKGEPQAGQSSAGWKAVTWTGKQILAVDGDGRVFSSAEGVWWRERGIAKPENRSIASNGDVLVAVFNYATISTSPEVVKASGVAPRKTAPHPANLGVSHAFRPDAAFDIFGRRTNSVLIKR